MCRKDPEEESRQQRSREALAATVVLSLVLVLGFVMGFFTGRGL